MRDKPTPREVARLRQITHDVSLVLERHKVHDWDDMLQILIATLGIAIAALPTRTRELALETAIIKLRSGVAHMTQHGDPPRH